MHNVLLLILIDYVQSLQTAVHHHFPGITWNAARDICKPFDLESRHDYLQGRVIPDGQEFWIGKAIYREPIPWIEIIGCYQIWESHENPFHSVTSIGTCKHKCDSEHIGRYFGYRKKNQSNCVCQPDYINESYRKSIKSCDSAVNFFVYKEYTGRVNMSSDPGDCTTICCGSCNTPTQNKNHLEGRRCSSVNYRIAGSCGKGVYKWGLDYFRSLDFCIQNNMLLPASNYCQGKGIHQYGQMFWTNVFREEVEIIKTKDVNDDPVRCFSGVFIIVNAQRILNMTDQMYSEYKNWLICKTNTTIPETATQTLLLTIDTTNDEQINTLSGQSTIPAKDITIPNTTAGKTIVKNEFTNNLSVNGDKSISIGAVIGGILGACFIIIVLAVLSVREVRSKRMSTESNNRDYEDVSRVRFSETTYEDIINTNHNILTAIPTQTCDIDDTRAPVYEEVNDPGKPQKIKSK